MQPLRQLDQSLLALADREHCVFAASDLAAAVPECGQLTVLLSRATKAGVLKRVCRGIYLYPVQDYPAGNLLFHAAARLRAGEFNYLSLETVLIDATQSLRHRSRHLGPHFASSEPRGNAPLLPAATVRDTIEKEDYWNFLADLVVELGKKAMAALQ